MPKSDALLLTWLRDACASGEARRLRTDARLSCAEVGADVGADQATVWRWETGRRRPRGDQALRYAKLLNAIKADIDARLAAS